ncbi:MAG: transposase [Anaerolineales bacterium]|nr:transposase [Anaerolineales bacterium]
MKFDPQKHHRRSIRLKGYDYSQTGVYYVTIVTQGRECIFGEIVNKEMILSRYGEFVQTWWDDIPIHFPNVEILAFVIMPNHIHGIIFITDNGKGEVISPVHSKPTLGQVIAYFKYQSTKEMNALDNKGVIKKFWQRNYYEHIIRNEKELKQKTDYILDNPSKWDNDAENLMNK